MKKTLAAKITSAILAVVFTAGLGTAALASAEPSGERTAPRPGAEMTQSFGEPERAPDDVQDRQPSGEPGSGLSEEPGEQPGNSPSGEPGEQPGNGPSEEPSGEPGNGPGEEPSGEPGNGPSEEPSGEPGRGAEQGPDRSENGERGGVQRFLEELIARILRLFGFGGTETAQPSQEFVPGAEPGRDPGEAPSGEPDVSTGEDTESRQASGEPSGESSQAPASGEMSGGSGEMGGASGEAAGGSAANVVTGDSTGADYTSANGDENAVLVSGDTVTLTGVTVTKTGSSSGESADFYGVNAGVLATNGATLSIEDATITTDGTHANGVFSYGTGTVVNISDSVITTSANNSGGIMTTGGATLNAENLTVSTSGNSSAAIRSDRGGGTVTVTEGTYDTSGVGSPAIYSTADITVSDAALTSTASEAVVIEGGNSVTLVNDAVSGNNARLNGQSTVKTNVLIYQSMSGDAQEGSSSFTMTGGSMTAGTGAMFHVTNVTTTITLSGVDFTYAADSDVFLDASSDAWGTAGKNGGHVTLNLDGQDIVGVITTDESSTVAVNLTNGSTWTLTGDSYVTSLSGDTSGIELNGYTLYVGGTAWNG